MRRSGTHDERELAELRRLFADLRHDTSPCDDESLVRLVLGELGDDERQRVGDQVVLSTEASDRYRILAALHRVASTGLATGVRTPRLRVMAIAAVAVLAVGAAVLIRVAYHGPIGSDGSDALRSSVAAAVRPVDGAILAAPPTELQWTAQRAASGYRVRLFDADAQLLWHSSEVREPRLQLPAGVDEAFKPGQSYMWTVDVGGAVQRQRLGPYWFTVDVAAARP